MRIVSIIVLVVIVLLGVMFASLNATDIEVNYLIGQSTMPLVVLMFITFMIGLMLGAFMMIWKVIKLKAQIHRLKSDLKKVEKLSHVT